VFTPQVLDYFGSPRCAGDLPGATASVEVTNPACGDILQLAARIEDGRIVEARFLARGCVTSIACGSFLAESLQGKTIVEARAITAESIAAALGGLPPATYHGSQLARDALDALLARIA
jgi:NifU-like protein involved in Fe-S cluster formation